MPGAEETDRDRAFCEEIVSRGWATADQVSEVRRLRSAAEELGQPTTLDALFVRKGFTSQERVTIVRRDVAAKLGQSLRIGKYEILQRLGEGGSGIVYRAYQTTLDREVALKVLTQRREGEEDYVNRFLREAKVAVTLNHVNIVRGLDFGNADGYHYFAMELVDGESLMEIIRREGRLSEARAIDFALQMVRALEHASKYQIVHRDIKPENILVTKSGTAKLCDLGLARPVIGGAGPAAGGRPMGTALYVAPEQIRHEANLDFRADIYALGATLFHAVTGSAPYGGSTIQEIVRAHISAPIPNPRDRVLEISTGAAAVVMKMLSKDPADRYHTLESLDEDLESVLAGRPPVNTITIGRRAVGLGEGGPTRATERPPRSKALVPTVVLLSLAALAAGAWFVFGRKTGAPPPPPPAPLNGGPKKDTSFDSGKMREAKETAATEALAAAKAFAAGHGSDSMETEEKFREVDASHPDTSSGRAAKQLAEGMARSRSARIGEELKSRSAVFEKAFAEGRLGEALAAWKDLPGEVEAGGGKDAAAAARARIEEAGKKAHADAKALAAKALAGDDSSLEPARRALGAVASCGIEALSAEASKELEALEATVRDRAAKLLAAEQAWPRICAEALAASTLGPAEAAAVLDRNAQLLAPLGGRARELKALLDEGNAFLMSVRSGFSKAASGGEAVKLRVAGRPGGVIGGRAGGVREEGLEIQRGPTVDVVPLRDVDPEDLALFAWKVLGTGAPGDHRGAAAFFLSRGAFGLADGEAKILDLIGAKEDAAKVRVLLETARAAARSKADASLQEAEVLRLQKRLPEARAAYEKAASVCPDYPLCLWKLGAFLLENGKDPAEGVKPLEAAAALAPAEPEAWYWIGEARRRTGKAEEAATALDHFLAAAPADHPLREAATKALEEVRATLATGAAKQAREDAAKAFRKDDFAGAEELWRKVLRFSPEDTDAMYYLGKSLLGLDRKVDGYSWLRRFLNAEKHSNARVDDAKKVVKDLEQRLSENPAAVRKAQEGAALTDGGKPVPAIEMLTAALDLAPLRGDTYVERARALVYAWQGEARREYLNQAAQDLETAILINEKNGRAWSWLALVRYKGEEFAKAADASTRGVQLDPGWQPIWEYRIRACNRVGRFAEAEQSATEAIAKGPKAVYFLGRADARCGLGKLKEARADLDAAVEKYALEPEEKMYRVEVLDRILKAEKGVK